MGSKQDGCYFAASFYPRDFTAVRVEYSTIENKLGPLDGTFEVLPTPTVEAGASSTDDVVSQSIVSSFRSIVSSFLSMSPASSVSPFRAVSTQQEVSFTPRFAFKDDEADVNISDTMDEVRG
jgi:hypothetical protein